MKTEAKKWEELASESISDAAEWKAKARAAESVKAELLAALKMLSNACYNDDCKHDAHDAHVRIMVQDAIDKAVQS